MTAYAFGQLALAEARSQLREPIATFFIFVFPVLLLVIIGAAFGETQYSESYGDLRTIDLFVPSMFGLGAANLGLMGIPAIFASYREHGMLRRYRVTPMRVGALYTAHSMVQLGLLLAVSALLVGLTLAVYGLRFPGSLAAMTLVYLLAAASMFSLGFMLAGVARTTRQAQAVGAALFFPGLLMSGATFPRDFFPAWLQNASLLDPMTPMVDALNKTWAGRSLADTLPLTVSMALITVAALALARLTFRWE